MVGLSIDGGGIRGYVPARLIEEIERRLGGELVSRLSMIGGTSTGSIIGAGLAVSRRGADLARLYRGLAPQIFRRRRRFPMTLWKSEFPLEGPQEVLQEYLGETLLGHVRVPLLVTAYDVRGLENGRQRVGTPVVFKSWRSTWEGVPLWRVVLASSTAPTSFPALEMTHPETGRRMVLIDGGVFAQNPAAVVSAELFRLGSEERHTVISLGTGTSDQGVEDDDFLQGGLLTVGRNIVTVFLDSGLDYVDYLVRHSPTRYVRLQVDLPPGTSAYSGEEENFRRMDEGIDRFIEDQSHRIDEVVEILVQQPIIQPNQRRFIP